MCDAIFITKSGIFKAQYAALDEVSNAAASYKDLLHYRCFEVSGRKTNKKKKLDPRD